MATPITSADAAELQIHVHPDVAPDLDLTLLREQFEFTGSTEPSVLRCKMDEGADGGRYVNLVFETSDRAQLWLAIQENLYTHPTLGSLLAKSSIAVCTGAEGWDDYLLLHHFDPEIALDSISAP